VRCLPTIVIAASLGLLACGTQDLAAGPADGATADGGAERGDDGASTDTGEDAGATPADSGANDTAASDAGPPATTATPDTAAVSCTPGTSMCDGQAVKTCDTGGNAWKTTATCVAAEPGKSEVCVQAPDGTAECVQQTCVPGTQWCAGGAIVLRCSASGLATKVLDDCTDGGTKPGLCKAGKCVDQLCKPAEAKCSADGKGVQTCAADGLSWGAPTACDKGHICNDAACKKQLCKPGESACGGDVVQVCNAHGTAMIDKTDCAKFGNVCFAAKCANKLCNPGEATCSGKTTYNLCVDNGTKLAPKTCPAGNTCVADACKPTVCAAKLKAAPVNNKVDIIWLVSTANTMIQEMGTVEKQLNAFFAYVSASALDCRVVLVGKGSKWVPLAHDAGKHLPAGTFLWVQKQLWGHDLLYRVVMPKTTGGYVTDFKAFLRPDAAKHIVAVSDNNSTLMKAQAFSTALGEVVHPGNPPAGPLFAGFRFHSVVGDGQHPSKGCATAVKKGVEYLALSAQTGGAKLAICEADWQPMFTPITKAKAPAGGATPGCLFALPAKVVASQPLIDKATFSYGPADKPTALQQVNDASTCGSASAFWFVPDQQGATHMALCPGACTAVAKQTLTAKWPCP